MSSTPPAFDVAVLLDRLRAWCATQEDVEARLVLGAPMTDAEIDAIPGLLSSFPLPVPTPWDPSAFVIPAGYRALLRRAGGVAIALRMPDDDEPTTWEVFHVFSPGPCDRAHIGARHTLCDSWTTGASLDGRPISTTDLVSFASAGLGGGASRWCFVVTPGAPPAVVLEHNDAECLVGRFVDTGERISDEGAPGFPSFEAWLIHVVDEITSRDLDEELDNDEVVEAIVARGAAAGA